MSIAISFLNVSLSILSSVYHNGNEEHPGLLTSEMKLIYNYNIIVCKKLEANGKIHND